MGVRPHVVIVGAGFGGLAVARGLDKLPVEVTLVDRQNFTTFQPLLYQVATSGLNAADVAHPVRGLFHRQRNLRVPRGEVVGVDWDAHVVHLADERDVPFDHLVVAVGAVATWFGVPGAEEHATPLYTLDDAVRLRNHVLERFEAADADPDLIDAGELNFVVVGGGPTGVETAGALAELFSVVFKRDYPTLGVGRARVVLVEARDALLGPFHASSQRAALDTLRARQVEVRLDETVDEVTTDHVRFASGEVLPTHTVIWAAGVTGQPGRRGARACPPTRGGRVAVGPDLRVDGHADVWALGDVAAAPEHRGDGVAAPAGAGGHAVGGPRGPPDRPGARGPADPAVPLPGQGHDGDDRPPLGRRRAARPHPPPGHAWPGSPGSGCTCCTSPGCATGCRCCSTGRGATAPGTAGPASSSATGRPAWLPSPTAARTASARAPRSTSGRG